MVAPRLTPGGLATQYSSAGHYELATDQALIITLPVTDAPYLGFQLGSLWYISLDYINHQTSLNGTQAQADPDGKIRIVVADRNPGVTNWVETLGHRKGFLQFRWQRVSRELTEADGPHRRAGRPRQGRGRAAVLRDQQDLRRGLARADCAASDDKSPTGWWGRDGRIAGQQGRRDQRCRPGAGHHAGAAMRRGRCRPGAGRPHRRASRRRRQADHRHGPARGVGRHRHHRRGSGRQSRARRRWRPTARSTC